MTTTQPASTPLTKITTALMASQAINYAASSLFITVAAIIVVRLAGNDESWTGIPSALTLVGQAAAAYFMARLMDRIGRRPGLAIGHVLGLVGAVIAGVGALASSAALFLLGVVVLGLCWGTLDLARYAAADASPADRRARSLSLVVLGGLIGAVAGPSLIQLSETIARGVGLPDEAGVWPVIIGLSVLGAAAMMLFLRPDPSQMAHQLDTAAGVPTSGPAARGRNFLQILLEPRARLAVGGLVFSQLAMVTVMTVMPIHMSMHQKGLGDISWVLTAHTIGMTGFSFFTGWLADRFGKPLVILVGGLLLSTACIIAPLQTSLPWLAFSLFLLGLGWNFSYVGSSSLLDEALRPEEKGVGQGSADALVKFASGAGSLGSGVIFALRGFAFTSWLTIMVAVLPAVLAFFLGLMRRPGAFAERSEPAAD